jgi:hypothetical protein
MSAVIFGLLRPMYHDFGEFFNNFTWFVGVIHALA